jgi:hypothetical protein
MGFRVPVMAFMKVAAWTGLYKVYLNFIESREQLYKKEELRVKNILDEQDKARRLENLVVEARANLQITPGDDPKSGPFNEKQTISPV